MKKMICMFFLILYLTNLSACSNKTKMATANFYYLDNMPHYHTNETVIQPESRELSITLTETETIIREYLDGPNTKQLTSPFPSGTKLISIQPGKEMTEIVLSDEIAQLSGIDLTVACACLSATILEISQSESVHIRAETANIGPQGYVIMDQQSIPFLG